MFPSTRLGGLAGHTSDERVFQTIGSATHGPAECHRTIMANIRFRRTADRSVGILISSGHEYTPRWAINPSEYTGPGRGDR